jgi:hypothetical protein
MSRHGEYDQSLEGVKAATAARSAMKDWSEGAELIEVVRSTQAVWLGQLRSKITASERTGGQTLAR